MEYRLGVEVGVERSAWVALGHRAVVAQGTVASAVALTVRGEVVAGDAALAVPAHEMAGWVQGFVGRLGEPEPLLLGTTPYGAEALTALVVAAAVAEAQAAAGQLPGALVLVHPDGLDPYRVGQLTEAARLAGVPAAVTATIARSEAAALAATTPAAAAAVTPATGAAAHGWQRWPATESGAGTVALAAGGAAAGGAAVTATLASGGTATAAAPLGGPLGSPLPAAGPPGTPLTPTAGPGGTPFPPTAGPGGTPLPPASGPPGTALPPAGGKAPSSGRSVLRPRKPWVKAVVGGAAAAAAVVTTVVIVRGDDDPPGVPTVTDGRGAVTDPAKVPDVTGGGSTGSGDGDRFDVSGLLGTYLGPCEPFFAGDGASQGMWAFEDTGVDQVTMTASGFDFITADCTGTRDHLISLPIVFTVAGVTEIEGMPTWQVIDPSGEKGVVAVGADGTMRFGTPGQPTGADGFPIQLDPVDQAAHRTASA